VAATLTDGTAVLARSTGLFGSADNARLILRAVLDVRNGDAESYVRDSDDFGTLVDELGGGALQSARTHTETDATDTDEGAFADEAARGVTSSFVDAGIETTFALVFTESGDVDAGDLEDWVETAGDSTFANFESVDVSTSGRTALLTGTEPTREYDFYSKGSERPRSAARLVQPARTVVPFLTTASKTETVPVRLPSGPPRRTPYSPGQGMSSKVHSSVSASTARTAAIRQFRAVVEGSSDLPSVGHLSG
jgi:hypothetical protein